MQFVGSPASSNGKREWHVQVLVKRLAKQQISQQWLLVEQEQRRTKKNNGCAHVVTPGTRPWSKSECKLCVASWDWFEEFDSDSTRDSDHDICPSGQKMQARRKASDEYESAMDLDAKQAEFEERSRFEHTDTHCYVHFFSVVIVVVLGHTHTHTFDAPRTLQHFYGSGSD